MFATNENLNQFCPECFEQGVDDWTDELLEAQQDVMNFVEAEWYNLVRSPGSFDSTKLVEAQWMKSTVYAALTSYIMPKLSTFLPDGDPFMEQIVFYRERLADERDIQFRIGIKYDTDGDGEITASEEYQFSQVRLFR